MWEEPRPERIPGRSNSPAVNLVRLLITVALISGVTLVLSNKLWPGFSRAPGNALPPPTAEAAPAWTPAPSPVDSHRRTNPAPALPNASAPPRQQTTVSRGDPGVLQTLSETCRYWAEQNTRGQYSANQQMACDDMTRYAHEFGMRAPVISGRGPTPPAQRSTAQPASRVYVNQCDALGHTTIAYRQCRAAEQDRLNNWCSSLRTQLEAAGGARRDTLRRDAHAVCGEASRYQIVR